MNSITLLLSDYTFHIVALGSAVLGIISGTLGSFAVLRKQSLLGDGVSHSALSGVVLAFLFIGSKDTEILLMGALAAGLAATLLITLITKYTRIKFGSALALGSCTSDLCSENTQFQPGRLKPFYFRAGICASEKRCNHHVGMWPGSYRITCNILEGIQIVYV